MTGHPQDVVSDNTTRKSEQLLPKGTVPLPFMPSALRYSSFFGFGSWNWFQEANLQKPIHFGGTTEVRGTFLPNSLLV